MSSYDDVRLISIAWRLDRLRWVDEHTLDELVRSRGTCMRTVLEDEPEWADRQLSDRELAEQLCTGCPVADECLELELRTSGAHTLGTFGGLSEQDRSDLHFHWRQRGERASTDERGGENDER